MPRRRRQQEVDPDEEYSDLGRVGSPPTTDPHRRFIRLGAADMPRRRRQREVDPGEEQEVDPDGEYSDLGRVGSLPTTNPQFSNPASPTGYDEMPSFQEFLPSYSNEPWAYDTRNAQHQPFLPPSITYDHAQTPRTVPQWSPDLPWPSSAAQPTYSPQQDTFYTLTDDNYTHQSVGWQADTVTPIQLSDEHEWETRYQNSFLSARSQPEDSQRSSRPDYYQATEP